MRKPAATTLFTTLILASFTIGSALACDKGGSSMHSKGSGFGGKDTGKFVPGPVAQMPAAPNPTAFAAYAQHRQALAMQAAAYRAARRPMKLAKAYEMRQATLAARESRKAWVLAKQEERKRLEKQDEATPSPDRQSPVLVAMNASR